MHSKRSPKHLTKMNNFRRRAAIVFGIVMTMPDAPASDTLEYLALKMLIKHWPTAQADSLKSLDKLETASRTTRTILYGRHMFSSNRVNNAVFRAESNIRRARVDYGHFRKRKTPMPTGFLLSAIEHSLTHEYKPWREQMTEVR